MNGEGENWRAGIYYDGLHSEISADTRMGFKKLGDMETWLRVSAKIDEFTSPSILAGCFMKYGNFEADLQYVWKGSGYIDFAFGDPAYEAKKWAFYGDVAYNFKNLKLRAFMRYNSSLYTDGEKPVLDLKVSLKDLTLKVGTGDLHSELPGDQKILLEWKGYVSIPIPVLKVGRAEKKGYLTPTDIQKDENGNGKSNIEGQIVKVKGVVTVNAGILEKNTSLYHVEGLRAHDIFARRS